MTESRSNEFAMACVSNNIRRKFIIQNTKIQNFLSTRSVLLQTTSTKFNEVKNLTLTLPYPYLNTPEGDQLMRANKAGLAILVIFGFSSIVGYEVDCTQLKLGQYICPDPAYDQVDPATQQFYGCTKENKAKVLCRAADGIVCTETKNSTFRKEMPCKWTNGYSFETALLLSIFLGMFGIDRFYLGYPGIGLLKLCTMGFMFMGQLVDIILIATQIVGPADGSYYVIPYYGAGIEIIRSDNTTYRLPQTDW